MMRNVLNVLQRKAVRSLVRQADRARDEHRWNDAATIYNNALKRAPNLFGVWVQYGHALKETGQLEAAEGAYRRALDLSPNIADTHLQLGHVLKLRKQNAAAMDSYLRSYTKDPASPHAKGELRQMGWTEDDLSIMHPEYAEKRGALPAPIVPTRIEQFRAATGTGGFDEERYVKAFPDVSLLQRLGLVASAEQHFVHYGQRQGREILLTFYDTPPTRVFVLCPSFFKRCGIGEHSRYLADSLETAGFEVHRIRTTADLEAFSDEKLRDAVVIVNHGPGLFDGYNPQLSEGEATIDVITRLRFLYTQHNLRPIVFMHSLLDRDNEVMFPRQQLWLECPIPVVTTIEAAARTFNILRIDHGMQPLPQIDLPAKEKFSRDNPTIGFFGFFQWGGKDFDALFTVAERLRAKLVGSVATGGQGDIEKLREMLTERNISCDIGTGWVDDSELARRLAEADFYYLPQHDYDHWNNSGTARFVMNFGKPVIVPPHNPFLDLRDFVIFSSEYDLPALMARMRDENQYTEVCRRIQSYGENHPMAVEMPKIARGLAGEFGASQITPFLEENAFSTYRLLALPLDQAIERLRFRGATEVAGGLTGDPLTEERYKSLRCLREVAPDSVGLHYPVAEPVRYWRDHYEIEDLLFPDHAETVIQLHRAFLKRDARLKDMQYAGSMVGRELLRVSHPLDVAAAFRLMRELWTMAPALEFMPRIQLYDRGRPITSDDLADTALIERYRSSVERRLKLMASDDVTGDAPVFLPQRDYNIFELLLLPSSWQAKAFGALTRAIGKDIDLSRLEKSRNLQERYLELVDLLPGAGIQLTQLGVLDELIVGAINPVRRSYGYRELAVFDGDAFIINAYRSLFKRNPHAYEMIVGSSILHDHGKNRLLAQMLKRPGCNATVVEIEPAGNGTFQRDLQNLKILIGQFRSAYSGGWQLRNSYLETKRNFDRDWLGLKRETEIWHAQGGDELHSLLGHWE